MKTLILIFISIIVITSCCKKKSTSDTTINQFTKTDFPFKVGNWWQYRHGDFLGNTTDTILLRVVSLSANKFLCHIEQNNTIIDSANVIINDNQISYQGLNLNYSYFGDFQIFFPTTVGDKKLITLPGSGQLDSISVVSFTQNYNYLGKPYDVYFLKRKAVSPGYSLLQTLSISKNIGIVENSINYFNRAPVQNQTLQLIDYKLN